MEIYHTKIIRISGAVPNENLNKDNIFFFKIFLNIRGRRIEA